MRLWHQKLIKHLPRQQLLGQHRECCALRGLGWRKSHSTVNYVFKHSYYLLYRFHVKVMDEMMKRDYKPDYLWYSLYYRGKNLGFSKSDFISSCVFNDNLIYLEHDLDYLIQCLHNLNMKGINLTLEQVI